MNKILEKLLNDEQIKDIANYFSRHKEFNIYGLGGSQKVAVIAAAYAKNPRPTIILTSGIEKISEWQTDLENFLPDVEVVELPELDLFTIRADTVGLERFSRRMEILTRLMNQEKIIVLATPGLTF